MQSKKQKFTLLKTKQQEVIPLLLLFARYKPIPSFSLLFLARPFLTAFNIIGNLQKPYQVWKRKKKWTTPWCSTLPVIPLLDQRQLNTNPQTLFWWDNLKVAKNFLGPEIPLSAFWQRLNFGETLSEEAEKVLGYLVAKHFLGPEMQLSAFWQKFIMARHFQRKRRKFLAKIKHLPKCESGISGPRKFLATFKVSRQNMPLDCPDQLQLVQWHTRCSLKRRLK